MMLADATWICDCAEKLKDSSPVLKEARLNTAMLKLLLER